VANLPTEQQAQNFEAIARERCAHLLSTVREAFRPSDAIEAIVLVAFAQGAAWALDIDMKEAQRRGWSNKTALQETPHG
jgi:hypothetical protein